MTLEQIRQIQYDTLTEALEYIADPEDQFNIQLLRACYRSEEYWKAQMSAIDKALENFPL